MASPRRPKFAPIYTPRYTPIPDVFFDEIMPYLNGAEIKVFLFICRKTFGWKKEADNISTSQITEGTGLQEPTVKKATRELCAMNLVLRQQNSHEKRGSTPSTYSINTAEVGSSESTDSSQSSEEGGILKYTPPGILKDTPRVSSNTPTINTNNNKQQQETVVVASLLIGHGISKGVAYKLAKEYDQNFLRDKVAHLEFLLVVRPHEVKKPAAWLRSAIEKDYAAPDGFKSTAEQAREQAAAAEREAALEAQKQRLAAEEEQRRLEDQQREKQRLERLVELKKEHGTGEKESLLWDEVVRQLTGREGHTAEQMLDSTYLLAAKNEEAVIAVRSRGAAQLLEQRLGGAVLRLLAREKVKRLRFLDLSADG